MRKRLILGSSSPYRYELLKRLGLVFEAFSPDIDESPQPSEAPVALVKRLALAKAQAIAASHTDALIIASDQICLNGSEILGKPHTKERACEQLRATSGKKVEFLTSLCLFDAESGEYQLDVVSFNVHFLPLTDQQISQYVDRELPLNCAGSFKSEGLGIALFEKLEGDDPNALIGLPLIRLVTMLRKVGVEVLG